MTDCDETAVLLALVAECEQLRAELARIRQRIEAREAARKETGR